MTTYQNLEKHVADLRKIDLTLPDVVLAYSVLNSANLPQDKVDLALNTVKNMTYKDMCITLSKMFSVQTNLEQSSGTMLQVKTEEYNYTQHCGHGKNKLKHHSPGNFRGRVQQRGYSRGVYHLYNSYK